LGNIKILYPPKNSIFYGYAKVSFISRQYSWNDRHEHELRKYYAASPLLNNFGEACPMVCRISPPLDKFSLPMQSQSANAEQSHYDVIRALI